MPSIYPQDAVRFCAFVDRSAGPDGCWIWTAGKVNGYGSFRLGKRKVRAHRVAWVMWSGQPEPEPGLHLDHACHDPQVCFGPGCPHRACVNPAHLRVATPKENTANSNALPMQRKRRTHCPAGHPFDAGNTYHYRAADGTTGRQCRPCNATNARPRRVLKGRRADLDTHCPHGHEWTPDNTYVNPQGRRVCRTCTRESHRASRRAEHVVPA